jgi:DNA modification methylase
LILFYGRYILGCDLPVTDRASDLESANDSLDSISHLDIVGDIEPNTEIPDGSSILIVSKDQSYLTHGIHRFPAKFFPELPRYLIRRHSIEGDVILDPMCGSGTVILESLLNNRVAVGIDIDPIARLITKVKTTPIDPDFLQEAIEFLLNRIQELDSACDYSLSIPNFHYRDSWFRPFVLNELALIRGCIESLPEQLTSMGFDTLRSIDAFLRVVMSSIIREVSNADPHCTRTVIRKKVRKKITPGDTLSKFLTTLSKQIEGMNDLWNIYCSSPNWDVHLPEESAIDTGLDSETIDLAITSPPYINAVDYPRTHQLEMYWLNLLDNRPLSHVKRNYIGTETVYKKEYQDLQKTGLETLDPILKQVYEIDPRRSYIIYKFFIDMEAQLYETMRVLKPGGRYCLAIGNNSIRGIQIQSHDILAEIATKNIGFELDRVFFSKLIRHFIRIPRKERMLGEWVLILEKPK